VQFKHQWRPYQQKVLDQLADHLSNRRAHIVAAPGSGKTILGLEIVRRLDKPTLILCPTLTIRQQWIDRFTQHFLPNGSSIPDWISTSLSKPNLLTVATYQAVYAAYQGLKDDVEEDSEPDENNEDEELEDDSVDQASDASTARPVNVAAMLKAAGVEVLVVDEAHHLKAGWWHALKQLRADLGDPQIVALTATPPYDVPVFEWERYKELCGSVDVEVSVPEMVLEGNLCPHQDYLCLSVPTKEESLIIKEFHGSVLDFFEWIKGNSAFSDAIAEHPWIARSEFYIEDILSNPAYFSSMLIFLNATHLLPLTDLVDILGVSDKKLPELDLEWLEILLTNCLFRDQDRYSGYKETMQIVSDHLKQIGAVERRQVVLQSSQKIDRLLTGSVSKMGSIVEILRNESEALGPDLRMVILTDFIRRSELPSSQYEVREPKKLGVAPIFDVIRREVVGDTLLGSIRGDNGDLSSIRLGVLSGSLVIIPDIAVPRFREICLEQGMSADAVVFCTLDINGGYVEVTASGSVGQRIVSVVTQLFQEGEITVLVGTKSLLGEGWDAPCINSLVLASNVGSFVLSNQMRGRAIRTVHGCPSKVANVWHLACINQDSSGAGKDYKSVVRRFKAFTGLAIDEDIIENGIDRLELGEPPFDLKRVNEINMRMFAAAADRKSLLERWRRVLALGTDQKMVEEVRAKASHLPRGLVLRTTANSVVGELLLAAGGGLIYAVSLATVPLTEPTVAAILAFAPAVAFFPVAIASSVKGVKHIRTEWSLKQIGLALLEAMLDSGLIKQGPRLDISVTRDYDGSVRCGLIGGTSYEQSLFAESLEELLGPVENPRYLLVRNSFFSSSRQVASFTVPSALGAKKELALKLHTAWKKHIGKFELVYTRTVKGRKILLQARSKSTFIAGKQKPDRLSCWK